MKKITFVNPIGDLLFWKIIQGSSIFTFGEQCSIEDLDFQTIDLGLPNIRTLYWIDHSIEVDSFPARLNQRTNLNDKP